MPTGIYERTPEMQTGKYKHKPHQGFQKGHIQCQNGLPSEKQPNWRGGEKKHSEGYIFIYKPNHPFCTKQKYVFEHRLVVEKQIGRYLLLEEICHHLNKIRDDNCPENLMAFSSNSAHRKFHFNPNNVTPSEIVFDGRKIN